MPIVIAFDSAWGGTGWAICTAAGPYRWGWKAPGAAAWRMAALRSMLVEIEREVIELDAASLPSDPAPRVLIERAPKVYAGRGNQAAIGWGMGTCAGAILLWGTRPAWEYPWEIEISAKKGKKDPHGWRTWWGISGGRMKAKFAAIQLVQQMRGQWGPIVDGLPLHSKDAVREGRRDWDGPASDVAEAVLLGMGAATRLANPRFEIPKTARGPAAWRRQRERLQNSPSMF